MAALILISTEVNHVLAIETELLEEYVIVGLIAKCVNRFSLDADKDRHMIWK